MTLSSASDSAERKTILAASAPWLAAFLNVVPGLGTGYIYQRRWRAYWITAVLACFWLAVAVRLIPPVPGELAVGNPIPGLLGLATLTALEAFLAARRARMD